MGERPEVGGQWERAIGDGGAGRERATPPPGAERGIARASGRGGDGRAPSPAPSPTASRDPARVTPPLHRSLPNDSAGPRPDWPPPP